MATTITGPDGRQWTVRRRLAPRLGAETVLGRIRRRVASVTNRTTDGLNVADGCMSFDLDGIVVLLIVVAALLLLVFVVVPLLVVIVDLVILLVLAFLGIVARVAFRRPWVLEAASGDGQRHQWRVVGWRSSGERCREIAQMLTAGVTPPPDLPIDGP